MQLPLILLNLLLLPSILPPVHALGISSLPQCGVTCVNKAAPGLGCAANDAQCLCSKPNFVSSTEICAESTCHQEDMSTTVGMLNALCASATSAGPTSTTPASSTQTSPLTTSASPGATTQAPTVTSTSLSPSTSTSVTGSTTAATVTGTVSTTMQPGTTLSIPPNFLSSATSASSTTVVVATITQPPASSGARGGNNWCSLMMGAVGVAMVVGWSL